MGEGRTSCSPAPSHTEVYWGAFAHCLQKTMAAVLTFVQGVAFCVDRAAASCWVKRPNFQATQQKLYQGRAAASY
eukprot:366497-Chlamydomonas_euryale.AAC.7